MEPKENKTEGKIRLSYSLLDLWKRGKYEDAAKLYLHVEDRAPTEAMIRGSEFDRMAKDVAIKEHRLPDELGGSKLEGEITANEKLIVEYNDFFLAAELDVRAGKDIIELKCSEVQDSADYLTTLQVPFYLFVARLLELPVLRGLLYRYDPAKRQWDMSIMYTSTRIYEKVQLEIATYGQEIQKYFKEEGVI